MHCIDIDSPKLIGLVVGESVHRSFCDVETLFSSVNTKYIDALLGPLGISVCYFPACTTVGRIKVCDGWNTTNIGEVFQTAEGCETTSEEAVRAIRTSNDVKAGVTVVVDSIPAESRWRGEYNSRKGGESYKELHDDGDVGNRVKKGSFLL